MRFFTALVLLVATPAAAAPCPDPSSGELLRLVLPSAKAETIQVKPWKRDFCVALVGTLESEEKHAFAVALFTTAEEPLAKRLKASTGRVDLPPDESPVRLDLAKYAVSATQTAIGVRIKRHRGYASGEASLETLILYLPSGHDLQPILGTFMSYEADLAGEWQEDGTRDRNTSSGEAQLMVTKKVTQGHLDLIRTTGTGTQHLRWNAGGYVEVNDDPFTKIDLEIFGDR